MTSLGVTASWDLGAEEVSDDAPALLQPSNVSTLMPPNRPRVYFSDDGSQMTVVHVHADSASLDYHMDVAGPRFGRFADLVTLSSIHIFGAPSEKAIKQLEDKVRLLGTGEVTVHPPHTGFGRFDLR